MDDDLPRRPKIHHFSQGRPRKHVFQTLDSTTVAPPHRYDYWVCSAIYGMHAARANTQQRRDFAASVTSLATVSGEMHHAQSDSCEVARTRQHIRADGSEELSLLYVTRGRLTGAHERGSEMTIGPGQFYWLDATRANWMRFEERYSLVQLNLSRPALSAMFAGTIPQPELIVRSLNRSPLARLLGMHLASFPRFVHALAPPEHLALLDASRAFALTTIEGAFATSCPHGSHHEGLFASAQRYIHLHLSEPNLDAGEVALAIGCSRATLYRIFARHEASVASLIRERRLQALKALLERPEQSAPIAALAQRCGLYDTANLNRAFKQRFGLSPLTLRELSKRGTP